MTKDKILEVLEVISARLDAIESRLGEIETFIKYGDKLTEKRRRKSARQARWRAKSKNANVDANVDAAVDTAVDANVDAVVDVVDATVDATKGKEGGKREISPYNPLIEKKGEERENALPPIIAGARARTLPVPTLNQAVSFAATHIGKMKCPREVIEDWYSLCQMSQWCDKNGNPIHNWGHHLTSYAFYYAKHKAEADPERIPDARKGQKKEIVISRITRPANWRGTKKEDLENVL